MYKHFGFGIVFLGLIGLIATNKNEIPNNFLQPQVSKQIEILEPNNDLASKKISEKLLENKLRRNGKCEFSTHQELRTNMVNELSSQLRTHIDFYNLEFGFNLNNKNFNLKSILSENDEMEVPDFFYSPPHMKNNLHSLILKYAPQKNSNEFVRNLCNQKTDPFFNTYLDFSLGFSAHEAAHWTHIQYLLELGYEKDEIINSSSDNDSKNIISRLNAEGIAQYMEKRTNTKKVFVEPTSLENLNQLKGDGFNFQKFGYGLALKLVTPILDKNFKKGIVLLSLNKFIEENNENILQYYERILSNL